MNAQDTGLRRAILAAADALQPEVLAVTQRLARHRSVLGEEQSCLAEMETVFSELGFARHVACPWTGRRWKAIPAGRRH